MKKSLVIYAVTVIAVALLFYLFLALLSFEIPNGYYYLCKLIGVFALILFAGVSFGVIYFIKTYANEFCLDEIKKELAKAIAEGDNEREAILQDKLTRIRSAASNVESVRYQMKRRMFGRPHYYDAQNENESDYYTNASITTEDSDDDEQIIELLKKYMPPAAVVSSDIQKELPPISLED